MQLMGTVHEAEARSVRQAIQGLGTDDTCACCTACACACG